MIYKMKEYVLKKYQTMPIQVRASFWFLICSFMQKGISVISTPIFTRLLSTEEYGNFNVFNSWLSILAIFITLNLSYGVYTQGLIKFENEQKIFASSLQGLTLALVCGWTILYIVFKGCINKLLGLTTVQILLMLVLMWTSAVWQFWSAEQRVQYNYKKLVVVSCFVSFAKPIVGVIFVINARDKVLARILGLVLVELIAYSVLFISQMRGGKVFYSKKYWSYAIKFNLPLIPHYLAQNILNSSDRIMIKNMVGTGEAGIYSLAYSISLLMTLFNTALSQTISPWMYKKMKEKDFIAIGKIAYISMILIAVLNIILIMFAPEIVYLFAPVEYYEAIWIIPPVAMSAYFIFCYDFFARFEFYYEKNKFIMGASISGAVLNVVLNWIFIAKFGYYAAGYTTLFCYMINVICHYLAMQKICNEELEGVKVYDIKILLSITVAFMLTGFFLLLTYRKVIIRYVIIGLLIFAIIKNRKRIIIAISQILEIRKK